jgi:hypothetical protein
MWPNLHPLVGDLLAGVRAAGARAERDRPESTPAPAACRLSVIITCSRYLQRLRLSLRNWCHQRVAPDAFEVLVVNPASPDGTHEHMMAVARGFPHLAVRELAVDASLATNKGAMINRAARAARGDWIWLADADCLFGPTSAARVLRCVDGRPDDRLFFGERRHLTAGHTDALLAGRYDSLRDFEALARHRPWRPPDRHPFGFTQIVRRSVLERIPYREDIGRFDQTDVIFVHDCLRHGIVPEPVAGLVCLHLYHPFAWNGAAGFL